MPERAAVAAAKNDSSSPDVDGYEDDGNSGNKHGAKYSNDIDDCLSWITRWLARGNWRFDNFVF